MSGIQATKIIRLELKKLNNMPTKIEKNKILKEVDTEFDVILEKQDININDAMVNSKDEVINKLKKLKERFENITI